MKFRRIIDKNFSCLLRDKDKKETKIKVKKDKVIVILGPTASGKTSLAVKLADKFNGEIVSADSRQVYKGMDIGTGKDLNEYFVDGKKINYHLIDVADPQKVLL